METTAKHAQLTARDKSFLLFSAYNKPQKEKQYSCQLALMDEMMNSSALLGQSAAPPPFSSLDLGPGPLGPGPLGPGPGPPAGPGGSETELQKMLIDERMRCENHKTNYQTLKAEHARWVPGPSLESHPPHGEGDVARRVLPGPGGPAGAPGARQLQQEKLQLLLAEMRGELLDKTRQLEECRLQRLDVLRAQLQQEMGGSSQRAIQQAGGGGGALPVQLQQATLRLHPPQVSVGPPHPADHRLLEERGLHFDAEREKEALAAQYQSSDPGRDARRVEALLRDKAQLHLRLKGLQAEVTELRARSDDSGQQAESVQRSQLRQLADGQAALKALEAERQSARLQVDRVEAELRLAHEQNTQLTGRLHKAEREVNALTGQTDVEVLRAGAQRQKEALVEKEREAVRRDTAGHAHREEWEERLRGAQLGEESARKELHGLRARTQQQSSRLEELERRSADMEELQQLQEDQEVLRAELRTARCQAERSQQDTERLLEERSVRWLEEKHVLQENGQQLRHKYGQAKERLQRAASAQKKRRAQTESREQRLQQKIQLLEAKTEHLELERRAADSRHPVHSEEHANLNRRHRELQRRHGEFRHLLLGRHAPPATGSSSFPPSSSSHLPPGHYAAAAAAETSVQAFDSEVSQLRRRLDELENVQLHQMDELGGGPSTLTPDL
ncbi:hypothetical protein CRUP_035817 [Coryphaenoides rupestris]|nr:hypothetical protein CRUP_035817 [Coryphaenoides rupestris]